MFKKIFDAFLASSADPTKLSTFVRGFLLMLVPLVIMWTGADQASVNEAVDAIVRVVFLGASIVSAIQMAWGLGRKLCLGRWTANGAIE